MALIRNFKDIDDGVIDVEADQILDAPANGGAQFIGTYVGRFNEQQLIIVTIEEGGGLVPLCRTPLDRASGFTRPVPGERAAECDARRGVPLPDDGGDMITVRTGDNGRQAILMDFVPKQSHRHAPPLLPKLLQKLLLLVFWLLLDPLQQVAIIHNLRFRAWIENSDVLITDYMTIQKLSEEKSGVI
ncbi:MAG TPA: hypothetical protein VF267_10420 [Gammaproteobacteria bacterium]